MARTRRQGLRKRNLLRRVQLGKPERRSRLRHGKRRRSCGGWERSVVVGVSRRKVHGSAQPLSILVVPPSRIDLRLKPAQIICLSLVRDPSLPFALFLYPAHAAVLRCVLSAWRLVCASSQLPSPIQEAPSNEAAPAVRTVKAHRRRTFRLLRRALNFLPSDDVPVEVSWRAAAREGHGSRTRNW